MDPEGLAAAAVVVAPGRLGQMCWGLLYSSPPIMSLPPSGRHPGWCLWAYLLCSGLKSRLFLTFFPNFVPHFQTEVLLRRPGLRRRWSQLIDCVARRSEPTPPCLGHPIGAVQPFQLGLRVV